MSHGKISFPIKIAYSAPILPVSMLHVPALSMLPALYAKHSAVDLGVIGIILVLTRLMDAFTDPLIGFLSDQTESKLGARKPWVIAGVIISCIGVYFWFRPGVESTWVDFLIWSMVVYIGWTLIEIPHTAWLSELTHDYGARSSLSAYRLAATYLGFALFLGMPLWPIFATSEMTPEVTALASWFIIILLPILAAVAIVFVPQGAQTRQSRPEFFETMKASVTNKPLALFVGSTLAANLASGMVAGLYFFYLDNYLGILDRIGHIGLTVSVLSAVAAVFSAPLISRFGKHKTMAVGAAFNVLVMAGMALLQPGAWAYPGMLALFSLSAVLNAVSMVAAYALLADIVDYETLKSGKNRAGNFYAFQAFIIKGGVAIGGGVGFLIVAAFGFDPNVDNGSLAMAGFFISFIIIPMLLYVFSSIFAWLVPIDKRRHAIIQRRLAALTARSRAHASCG